MPIPVWLHTAPGILTSHAFSGAGGLLCPTTLQNAPAAILLRNFLPYRPLSGPEALETGFRVHSPPISGRQACMHPCPRDHHSLVLAACAAAKIVIDRPAPADFGVALRAEHSAPCMRPAPRAGFIVNIGAMDNAAVLVAFVLPTPQRPRDLDRLGMTEPPIRAHDIAGDIGPIMHGTDARQIDNTARTASRSAVLMLPQRRGVIRAIKNTSSSTASLVSSGMYFTSSFAIHSPLASAAPGTARHSFTTP